MIFGMPTLIELRSLEENVRLCKELGLSFIELNMNLPEYQLGKLENTRPFIKHMEQKGIFFTIHLDEKLNIADFNPLVAKAYSRTVLSSIQIAKALHVPILNMHMNPGVYFTMPDKKVFLYDQYREEYLNRFRTFREECESAIGNTPIRIAIENTDGFHKFMQEAIEILLESRVFTLTFDIGHSHVMLNQDEEFILRHQDRLTHFHIHDALGNANHLALGTGEINLDQRLQFAKSLQGRCVIETKTVAALKESIGWLQNWKGSSV